MFFATNLFATKKKQRSRERERAGGRSRIAEEYLVRAIRLQSPLNSNDVGLRVQMLCDAKVVRMLCGGSRKTYHNVPLLLTHMCVSFFLSFSFDCSVLGVSECERVQTESSFNIIIIFI